VTSVPINSSTPVSQLPVTEAAIELKALKAKVAEKAAQVEREEEATDAVVLLAKVKEEKLEKKQAADSIKQALKDNEKEAA
jgi:hypothetical protein